MGAGLQPHHLAVVLDRAMPRRERLCDECDIDAGLVRPRASAPAAGAVVAGRAPVIGLGQDPERVGRQGQAERAAAGLDRRRGMAQPMRRQRIRPAAPSDGVAVRAGSPDDGLGLDVVGLELVIAERPVGGDAEPASYSHRSGMQAMRLALIVERAAADPLDMMISAAAPPAGRVRQARDMVPRAQVPPSRLQGLQPGEPVARVLVAARGEPRLLPTAGVEAVVAGIVVSRARFEDQHVDAARRKRPGDRSAARAGAYDDDIGLGPAGHGCAFGAAA